MSYQPPKNIWEVDRQIKFNTPLAEDDPRYVHTEKGRGDFSLGPLLKTLGVDPKTFALKSPPQNVYALFCGHRGCGKSTELRRLCARLHRADRFFVVFLDATVDLDPNNLRYADVLLALAKALSERLQRDAIRIDQVFLSNLEGWFSERIETNARTHDFAVEVKAGAKAESGLPLLGKLFAEITNALKTNSTYKDELRKIVLALLEYNNFWRRSHPAVRRLEGYRASQGA